LLFKIQDLQEKLLETQLQLERVIDEKLTHMLSIQKSLTDKTGLGYVASSFDIPSTSKTVFVKPVVLEPPSVGLDKGKEIIGGDVPASTKATHMPSIIRRPPICHHCGLSGHIRPHCSLLKAQRSKFKKELPRQATSGTRPLARHQPPWHQAPWHQTPRYQALLHQRQHQRFVFANQNGKPKTNKLRHYMKKPQKPKSDQFYKELPMLCRA
jgi:hypothetical protein